MRHSLLLLLSMTITSFGRADVDVAAYSRALLTSVQSESAFDAASCAKTVNAITSKVEKLKSSDFRRAALAVTAKSAIQSLWQVRSLLRTRMMALHSGSDLPADCVKAFRRNFRSLRLFEEYLGLHTLAAGAWIDPTPTRVFTQGFPWLLQTPQWKKVEFRSGDVLVSYGMAYGSAAIAHVGEDAGAFSHMALIYKNSKNEIYTIEAHPEFGVKVALLEKYLADGKGRAAVFRHKDAKLAAASAEEMFKIASAADWSGHAIPYDFTMNADDHSKIFCTETVQYGFSLGAKRLGMNVVVPRYPTRISMQNTYILDSFGIRDRLTFAPSDIEVDPQFEMLGEWRDLARARLMHHQQVALQSQFRWLDTLNYNYHDDFETRIFTQGLWFARRSPLFDGLVSDLVPSDLSQTALNAVVQVYLVSDLLRDQLVDLDKVSESAHGVLLTDNEVMAAAESARAADLAKYEAYRRWLPGARKSLRSPIHLPWHFILRGE